MANTLIRQFVNAPFHSKEKVLTVSYVYSISVSKEQIRHRPHRHFLITVTKELMKDKWSSPNFFSAMVHFQFSVASSVSGKRRANG